MVASLPFRAALSSFTLTALLSVNSAATEPAPSAVTNPLLTESTLPYHLPPFAAIKDEHFGPAFEQGMAEELEDVAKIAGDPVAATFDNTIVALERSGELLDRVETVFGILTGAYTNLELDQLEASLSPRLAAHRDAIYLNRPLYTRVRQLYEDRAKLGLDAESLRLLERYHLDFVRAGAKLSSAEQDALKAMNAELATLSNQFKQNLLKETNADAVLVDTRDELAGLSDATIGSAAAAAKAAGHEGKYFLRLTNTTGQPAYSALDNRALRERIMAASLARCSHGGEFDNRAIVTRMAKLRAQRAQLLGYSSHAAYEVELQTARSVDAINRMLAQLAPPAVANARREAADMQTIIDSAKGGYKLGAGDWDYNTEKVRQAKYAFNKDELKPYYESTRVLEEGVFYAATRLYGITFKRRPDLQGYSPDMSVYEGFNADGSALALFLCDRYAHSQHHGLP